MNITAKFSFAKNESNNVGQSINVTLITDGCDSGMSEPRDDKDKHVNELIASLRTGEISNWDKDEKHIQKVLQERFEPPTVTKISSMDTKPPTDTKISSTVTKILQDIKRFLEDDTSHWKYLLEEAYKNGYRKEETDETIDWESLLHASYGEIKECIKDRGTHTQMTFRILVHSHNLPFQIPMHVFFSFYNT